MNTNNDLFPETLLVNIADGHTFTTSLKVAEHFQKRHNNVIRDIEKLLADCPDKSFSLLNFEQRNHSYVTGKNQVRNMRTYTMTEEGFALLAMGFTGKQALQWKIDFLNAFRAMETALRQQAEREASALYFLKPHWRTIGAGVKAQQTRQAICALTGHKSPDTITANKRRMRAIGLLH